MDLFGSISHGHAGSSVSMSLKNPKLIWCVMCAQTIQVCLHRVVETLPPVHPEVGRAWQPTSLFSQNVCAMGKWGFHREKWKLRLCWDCLLSYPCELNFRDFRLFAPFFWSYSSCCCPGLVEASDHTSLPCFSPCCCRNEEVGFFFLMCVGMMPQRRN